jgi:hypothetical protein
VEAARAIIRPAGRDSSRRRGAAAEKEGVAMKRILGCAVAIALATAWSASGAWAFGVKDVVQMHADGVADSLILLKVQHSGKQFHLDAGDLRTLKNAGVSDDIVSAMLQTEDQYDGVVGYGPYYFPHYPYYYGPVYYPRVVVGLRFGYYGYHRPYHVYPRAYYGPRFRR